MVSKRNGTEQFMTNLNAKIDLKKEIHFKTR